MQIKKDDSEGDKGCIYQIETKTQAQNPVMLLVYISAALTTVLWIISLFGIQDASSDSHWQLPLFSGLPYCFANFAEAIAEGRGKLRQTPLRAAKRDVTAYKILSLREKDRITEVPSVSLKKGDVVIVKAGQQIPCRW